MEDDSNSEVVTDIHKVLYLVILLAAQASLAVRQRDVQLLGALHDVLALRGADVVRNLRAVRSVVHDEHFQVRHVVHDELDEAIRQDVPVLLVRAISDVWHGNTSFELTATPPVDTARATP